MRSIAIFTLVIFLASSLMVPASASNVTVTIGAERVHASYNLYLSQNVTTLPTLTTTVDSNSNPDISAAFTAALMKADPSASATNLSVSLTSVKSDVSLTCDMDVAGVSQVNGNMMTVNMTWLPFDVTSNIRAQNFSFNTIGNTYFRSVVAYYANASRFIGRPNATISGVIFYVNGTSVGAPAAESYAGNFTTLNFGLLNTDVDQWNRTYTLTNDTTTWRFWPPKLFDFNMQVERGNATKDYFASYAYNATISVPGVGRSQGTLLLVGVGSDLTEWAMAAIVVLSVVVAIGVQARYRSRKKAQAKFQRK